MEMRFLGKVAVIAGASEGIGRATAQLMAGEGATVVAVARNAENLGSLAAEPVEGPGVVEGFPADLVSEEAVVAVVDHVVKAHGRIDILVNNIGGSTIVAKPFATVEDTSLDDFERMLRFNLVPTFLMCKYAGAVMKRQGSGKIVNLSSLSARGHSSISPYGAAKAGIESFTTKLSRELGPFGINVNAVAPGLVLTDRINRTIGAVSPEVRAERVKSIPLRRDSQPEDQARVIAFLCSSDADMVTGSTLDVSGGL
ncbi:MAG: SDR family NAD(P)-dependent oxidoreductase [Phenylobacterium sp.]|uniref:SDR family NAD(P)-dependent oxidoreductase n=1 Tax=Phenylobacterium sp. TaxID=1871053 RepID=UPI0027336D50|nr:SDR family NAD(P)-dependent oxidoreductase [Phenylobacterium sp.]MDP3175863.1 SDR family NAD(P)-dependent oxidoreductase [Phenylobacterium sp.]